MPRPPQSGRKRWRRRRSATRLITRRNWVRYLLDRTPGTAAKVSSSGLCISLDDRMTSRSYRPMRKIALLFFSLVFLVPHTVDAQTAAAELIQLWQDANERCRGGPGDSPKTDAACDERERFSSRLGQIGLCYGIAYQSSADRFWRPCADRLPNTANQHRATSKPYCVVDDPTPTSLNLRTAPYGRIIGTVTNGTKVTIIDRAGDNRGKPWVYISGDDDGPLGWVFSEYVKCF
jgi:hypothetical protein